MYIYIYIYLCHGHDMNNMVRNLLINFSSILVTLTDVSAFLKYLQAVFPLFDVFTPRFITSMFNPNSFLKFG